MYYEIKIFIVLYIKGYLVILIFEHFSNLKHLMTKLFK